jgi:hypothetical protein
LTKVFSSYTLFKMKRTTIFLPEEMIARLDAESERTSVKTAELIRRAINAALPPVGVSAGVLRNRLDRDGLLKVFVLGAREGRLLVEPGGGFDGMFEPLVQMWVPANLVTFPESAERDVDAFLASRPPQPEELRTMMAPAPEGFRTSLRIPPSPEALESFRTNKDIVSGAPVPTTCGICHQPFPSKAAKRRHVRDAHSAPIPPTGASKS